jgi:hypothetical protein
MKRWFVAGGVLVGMLAGVVGSLPEASASKQFTPITKMKCVKCHTTPKGSEKDLTDAGKASLEYLKKQDYKRGEWEKIRGFTWDK